MVPLHKVVADIDFVCGFGVYRMQAQIERLASATPARASEDRLDPASYHLLDPSACLREAARRFFEESYRSVLFGRLSLSVAHMQAIQDMAGLNRSQFAQVLGLDKGSLSNIMSGRRQMQRSTQLIALERLGMELARPGSMKGLLLRKVPPSSPAECSPWMDLIRFS